MSNLRRSKPSHRRPGGTSRARSPPPTAARASSALRCAADSLFLRAPLPMSALRRHAYRRAAGDVASSSVLRLHHRFGARVVWFVPAATARGAKPRQPLANGGRNGCVHLKDGAAVDSRRPRWPIISGCPAHPLRLDAAADSSSSRHHACRPLAAFAPRGLHLLRV